MDTHRVEAPRWKSFFEAFSRTHQGWPGSLEVRDPGHAPHMEVEVSPFVRAALETRDGRDALVLMFGEEDEEHFATIIHEPHALLTSEREDGSDASLVIETADGSRRILLLVNPVHAGVSW